MAAVRDDAPMAAEASAANASRRGAIDAARVGALLLVVIGHLSLAVIDRGSTGALRGANVLALHPNLAWAAMLAPMPVFFAAAGWANATATPATAAPRLRRLIVLSAAVVTVWSVASTGAHTVTPDGGIVADGARIATQPLWFLAAYLPFAAGGTVMSRLGRRPVLAIGISLSALAVLDAVRFGAGAPRAIAWPGFYLAWGVPWLLGAAWRGQQARAIDAETARRSERRTGMLLALGGAATATALVVLAGYYPSLIDAVPGKRSNTTPPTLFTAVAGITQTGLLMLAAPLLDRCARRHRSTLDRAGEASVGIYAWHLTALSLCAALLAAGLWAPRRFSPAWWATRPIWFALVLGVTAALTALTAWLEHQHTDGPSMSHPRILSALFLATTGAAIVGLWGPRTPAGALATTAGFVGASLLLSNRRAGGPSGQPPRSSPPR